MLEYLLIFIVGLLTSFASNITGGGAALILLPVLIGLGLSPIDAIGTIILGAVGFVIGSTISKPARGHIRRDHVIPLTLIVTAASVIGPLISINLPADGVKAVSGILIIATAIISLLTWNQASHARGLSRRSHLSGYALYFVTSILLAGFASGVGLLSGYILIGLVGLSSLETIATRRVAGLIGVPIQLLIYAVSGHVDLVFGLILTVANFIGAYYGINYAVKKGNDFVKKAMAVSAILLVITIFT